MPNGINFKLAPYMHLSKRHQTSKNLTYDVMTLWNDVIANLWNLSKFSALYGAFYDNWTYNIYPCVKPKGFAAGNWKQNVKMFISCFTMTFWRCGTFKLKVKNFCWQKCWCQHYTNIFRNFFYFRKVLMVVYIRAKFHAI